jgi:hypothetical protein
MNAEDVEIEGLTLEQGLPAMIAAMQFANWGRSTGFNSPEEYERFLCDAVCTRAICRRCWWRGAAANSWFSQLARS